MPKCLIRFDEYGKGMGLPSMKDSFENAPYDGQEAIVKYLRSGKKTYAATSTAYDFFTGKAIKDEKCDMTDGKFTWNTTLAYYVENYNLRLPKDFEEHVLSAILREENAV